MYPFDMRSLGPRQLAKASEAVRALQREKTCHVEILPGVAGEPDCRMVVSTIALQADRPPRNPVAGRKLAELEARWCEPITKKNLAAFLADAAATLARAEAGREVVDRRTDCGSVRVL